MSSHGKVSLRPLPHLDFVLGWPGIPSSSSASRNPAHLAGNVEVRLGSKGMKAKWLRIELRKIETVPGGENWGELIGRGPIDVWSAEAAAKEPGDKASADREVDADGSTWQLLRTADFPFRINIPEALPPSARLDKICGVQYEIVSSLCVKTKKGLLRKEDISSIIQSVQPITLDKHELHSTWPAYNQPDTHTGERDQMRAKLRRDRYCYAPGDKVRVKVIVSSNRVEPAKLKSVAVTIKETVTFHGVKPGRKGVTSNNPGAQPSMQRTEVVTQKAKQVGKKLYKGDSKDFDLELIIPKSHALMTISTAKHIEVSYTMRVYCDTGKAPIVIDHIPMMMTTFPRQTSLAMIKKIGFVEGLSERELVIDDDVDDASTLQGVSRSVRPAPTRSLSYSGSTSTASVAGYDQAMLNRRDTVLTQATGGMAGRGVPGMLYNHPAFGTPDPPSSPFAAGNGPRPVFAGPGGSYDEEGNRLSVMEQSALYHHSNNPSNAMAMGVNYEDVTSLEPTRSHFSPARDASPQLSANQRFSFAGFANASNGNISRPGTSQASEQEKERLYDRARQQAERNQRRADEHRAALAAGTLMTTSTSAPSMGHHDSTLQRPMSVDAVANLPVSEQEKLRLWERARREAEAYQRGYSEGTTFPAEAHSNAPSRLHTPVLPRLDETEALQNPHDDESRRTSAMFWLNQSQSPAIPAPSQQKQPIVTMATTYPSYQSAEQEKSRLYQEAKAQSEIHSNRNSYVSSTLTPSTSNNSASISHAPSTTNASASASATALSEKEQMKRYYEAQDAVRQSQIRMDAADASASSSSAAAPSQANSSTKAAVVASGHQALSEKEQLARYHAAQEEVQKHQAAQAGGSLVPPTANVAQNGRNALSEKEQIARYQAAQEGVRQHQAGMQQTPSEQTSIGPSAMTEKEQMRKYLEARDRESQGAGEGSAAPPTMISPRPIYAPNFHAMPTTPTEPTLRTNPASSPLPQGQFPASTHHPTIAHPAGQPLPGGAGSTLKPRVVSYTPQTLHSQQSSNHVAQSPSLGAPPPSLQGLSLNYRGSTPNPLDGPWAPKVATPAWIDDQHGHAAASGPPPVPPKTAIRP